MENEKEGGVVSMVPSLDRRVRTSFAAGRGGEGGVRRCRRGVGGWGGREYEGRGREGEGGGGEGE